MGSSSAPLVRLLDDDAHSRLELAHILSSHGWTVEPYACASDLLEAHAPERPGCLVAETLLPDMNGLELLAMLRAAEAALPTILLARRGTIRLGVQAMKLGAVDFLVKPVQEAELLDAVRTALARDEIARRERLQAILLRSRFARLTPRERQVLALLVRGLLNKQVAGTLGTTEQTVKVHRRRIMQKMEASSFAQLVTFADRLGPLLRDAATFEWPEIAPWMPAPGRLALAGAAGNGSGGNGTHPSPPT